MRPGARVALVGAPETLRRDLGPDLDRVVLRNRLTRPLDLILLFVDSSAALRRRFPVAKRALHETGGLWVAWPKRASGIATDLTENVVRDIGLDEGLVDTKVCAVDDTWSGLRFVYRLRDRPRR